MKKKGNKKRAIIILLAVLAALAAAWGIWSFFEYYDFSPVQREHYDDTTVASMTYTDGSGNRYTRDVTYGEIRYYVKYYGLTAEEALERVETDWVPEIIAGMYNVLPGLTLENPVDAEVEEYKAFTGEDNYEDVLAGQFMTPIIHRRFVYLKQLKLMLEESLCEDPDSPIIRDGGADEEAFITRRYGTAPADMDAGQLEEAQRAYATDVYQNLFADIQAEIEAEKTPLLRKIDSSVR